MTSFAVALASLLGLDLIWLGFVAKPLYRREIGSLLGEPRYVPGAIVYFLMAFAVMYFVLPGAKSGAEAAMRGALMGLVVYGVYDMTNLAVLKAWGVKVSIVDMAWGVFALGMASFIAFIATHR